MARLPAPRPGRELVLICCHFGVPWIEEAMCLVGKHTNVYVDTSYWATIEEPEIVLRHLLRCPRFGCTYDRILWHRPSLQGSLVPLSI